MGVIQCMECDGEMTEDRRFYAVTGDEDMGPAEVVAEFVCPICGHTQMERVEE
jgi:predicted RNA-binding Zn-ribbon protein involved in translation (DUF1610 family)